LAVAQAHGTAVEGACMALDRLRFRIHLPFHSIPIIICTTGTLEIARYRMALIHSCDRMLDHNSLTSLVIKILHISSDNTAS
jgi:hypothetical protein